MGLGGLATASPWSLSFVKPIQQLVLLRVSTDLWASAIEHLFASPVVPIVRPKACPVASITASPPQPSVTGSVAVAAPLF